MSHQAQKIQAPQHIKVNMTGMTRTKDGYICPDCRKPAIKPRKKYRWTDKKGKIHSFMDNITLIRDCNCYYDKNIDPEKTNIERIEDERKKEIYRMANIPSIYLKFNYPVYNPHLKSLKDDPNNLKTGLLLRITGLPGGGKTTAVSLIFKEAAEKGMGVFYESANKLVGYYGSGYKEKLEYIKNCHAIAIDDIGADPKQSKTTVINDIIEYGLNNGQSILLIHNVNRKQIQETFEWMDGGENQGAFERRLKMFDEIVVVKGW